MCSNWKSESSWYVPAVSGNFVRSSLVQSEAVAKHRACSALRIASSLVLPHCCCCCCCSGWSGKVEDDVQGVAFCSVCFPLLPFLPFSPCALSCLAHFLRGPGGCSPHSSAVSRRLQVWSVVDTDPPCVVPPCHVSVRHVALFVQ